MDQLLIVVLLLAVVVVAAYFYLKRRQQQVHADTAGDTVDHRPTQEPSDLTARDNAVDNTAPPQDR